MRSWKGNVESDIRDLVKLAERDNTSRDLKRQRIFYLNSLIHRDEWRKILGEKKVAELSKYIKHEGEKYTKKGRGK